ncbi:MAG: HIT family protein [Planctomycetes bacterium]|nr:HIT family protein [Planctomycetota bacterium]
MPSVFTRVIDGEWPGRFVWKDDRCVAFLSIAPLRPGHTLVVPREEIDHWLDLPPDLLQHLTRVAHSIGRAIQEAFKPTKVGLMIAGLEVRHVHLHLVPIDAVHDLDFSHQERQPDPAAMDRAAGQIRDALRKLGFREVSE